MLARTKLFTSLVHQASLEAMLLLRDALAQLAPAWQEASPMAGQEGAAAGWPGDAGQNTTPAAAAAGIAPAGGWEEGNPSPLHAGRQLRQLPQLHQGGGAAGGAPPPAVPSIFFKATAVIGEALVVCELARQMAEWPSQALASPFIAAAGTPVLAPCQVPQSTCPGASLAHAPRQPPLPCALQATTSSPP